MNNQAVTASSLRRKLAASVATGTLVMGFLVCTQSSASAASVINLNMTVSVPTTNDYVLFFGAPNVAGTASLGTLPPLTNFTFPAIPVPQTITSGYVTAIGLAVNANTTNPDLANVVIALGSGVVFSGVAWDSLFSTPESTIAAALQAGNTATLLTFFAANSGSFIAYSNGALANGNIAEFSNGVAVGTMGVVVAAAVPEPTTGLMMSFGFGGFAFLTALKRRKRLQ